ncbi:MAG: hypothetical protein EU539_00985 [Promethearchaeota archaeon]|nr:MAG: hypothetical protein EU539_00985 [Candidatus Lokiarchaeota archaeon]
MENSEVDEFNEKIIKAFATKAQRFEERANELEQNLKVKEAELEYVANLYDKEKSLHSLDIENANKNTIILENKLEELKKSNLEKDKINSGLLSQIENLNSEISRKDERIHEIINEINDFYKEILSKDDEIENTSNNHEDIHQKITSLVNFFSQRDAELKEQKEEVVKKEEIIKNQAEQIATLQAELDELKPPEISNITKERLICPKCGAVGKDIKNVEDKSKPLSYVGNMPMYAKIHVCKKCGNEF